MKLLNFDEFINEAAKYTSDRNHSMLAVHGLSLLDQIKIFHWQTEVGDAHKALGEFYDDFAGQLDELVEVIMGKYGRITVKSTGSPAPLVDIDSVNPTALVEKYVRIYESYRNTTFSNDPEIQNIIDEVIARIHKLKYLLTLS